MPQRPYHISSSLIDLLAFLQPLHSGWSDMPIIRFLNRISKKSKTTGLRKNPDKKRTKNEGDIDLGLNGDSTTETKDADSNIDKGSKTEIEKEKPDLRITQQ